jgi:FAD binding domain
MALQPTTPSMVVSGRGWAALNPDGTLEGHICVHRRTWPASDGISSPPESSVNSWVIGPDRVADAGPGLDLGILIASRDSATVGGAVAANAGGLRVLRFGPMRAQLRGIEAVLADGTVVSHLAGLVKDNTGYDYPSLLAGSEGTLAVITQARLRLVPRRRDTVTALAGAGGPAELHALARRVWSRPSSSPGPAWTSWWPAPGSRRPCPYPPRRTCCSRRPDPARSATWPA